MEGDDGQRSCFSRRSKLFWVLLGATLLVVAIALGVGLGVGLTQGGGNSSTPSTPSIPGNNTNATSGIFWKPSAGTSWQIILNNTVDDTSVNASVYDIDLFMNTPKIIADLHTLGRKVICYFSAGSYENYRPDSDQFKTSDKGGELVGWPGEYWLNTSSTNVRKIMTARLALAAQKGCDGVDPDNVDGYDNKENGFGLTSADAVDYLNFLAIGAHGLNMSLGLKNAKEVVPSVIDYLQWEVNEQCVQYSECDSFQPFIAAGKPVFHIEYPDGSPSISATNRNKFCNDGSAKGFSTVLKDLNLDDWVVEC